MPLPILTAIELKIYGAHNDGVTDLREVVKLLTTHGGHTTEEIIDAYALLEVRGVLKVDPPREYEKLWKKRVEAYQKRFARKNGQQ